jgi:hypothetical protein
MSFSAHERRIAFFQRSPRQDRKFKNKNLLSSFSRCSFFLKLVRYLVFERFLAPTSNVHVQPRGHDVGSRANLYSSYSLLLWVCGACDAYVKDSITANHTSFPPARSLSLRLVSSLRHVRWYSRCCLAGYDQVVREGILSSIIH